MPPRKKTTKKEGGGKDPACCQGSFLNLLGGSLPATHSVAAQDAGRGPVPPTRPTPPPKRGGGPRLCSQEPGKAPVGCPPPSRRRPPALREAVPGAMSARCLTARSSRSGSSSSQARAPPRRPPFPTAHPPPPYARGAVGCQRAREAHRRGGPTPAAVPQPRLTYARGSLGTAGCERAVKAHPPVGKRSHTRCGPPHHAHLREHAGVDSERRAPSSPEATAPDKTARTHHRVYRCGLVRAEPDPEPRLRGQAPNFAGGTAAKTHSRPKPQTLSIGRAPSPSRTPRPPTAPKSAKAPSPKKMLPRNEFKHAHAQLLRVRRARVACLLGTRHGHPPHAMPGKAPTRTAQKMVRRRPPRQREASAGSDQATLEPSRRLGPARARVAARSGRRRTFAHRAPLRGRRLATHPGPTMV